MDSIAVLATDMDGTFIPLDGNEDNVRDLDQLCEQLHRSAIKLVYVTGRHHESVLDAIKGHRLPMPEWLICDVGTSIYLASQDGHVLLREYHDHLQTIVGRFGVAELQVALSDERDLRLQETEKQGRFKLSYYCDAEARDELGDRLSERLEKLGAPFHMIVSVDPFNGDGLIDFLPQGVSKDFALRWWVDFNEYDHGAVVFAGDSGNDVAALTTGFRSIVVANADTSVAQRVSRAHRTAGWANRLHLAQQPATSGVLEGLRHFLATPRQG